MKKFLVGVCGMGLGHTLRQTPILRHLIDNLQAQVAIFAFGDSAKALRKYFPAIEVFDVAVPFVNHGIDGLDFGAAARNPYNSNNDYLKTNFEAMDRAHKFFGGKPDFVISDYEPTCAQYSYAVGATLLTIDQQSKYLLDGCYADIGSLTCREESSRLGLFFPKAHKRYACSFFKILDRKKNDFDVSIIPSFIRPEIHKVKHDRVENQKRDTLVYLSSFLRLPQAAEDILRVLAKFDRNFHLFSWEPEVFCTPPSNVKIYKTGSDNFTKVLSACENVITTGGHNFLSELMYLNIPAYVCPLDNYEQSCNAAIIANNKFGVQAKHIKADLLEEFLRDTALYSENIIADRDVLYKECGLANVTEYISQL